MTYQRHFYCPYEYSSKKIILEIMPSIYIVSISLVRFFVKNSQMFITFTKISIYFGYILIEERMFTVVYYFL